LTLLRKGGFFLKCTINRLEFLTAVKRCASIVPASSPLIILKCVLLEVSAEQKSLRVTATNLEVALEQTIPLLSADGADMAFAIDARLAVSMLDRFADETVELERCGSGQLMCCSPQRTVWRSTSSPWPPYLISKICMTHRWKRRSPTAKNSCIWASTQV
jgi:DNA polymerase III sliding clamp (beta) subunit (PCNA family)